MATTKEVLDKYSARIEQEMGNQPQSKDYAQFKQDMLSIPTRYERWAKSLGSLIKINVSEKDRKKIEQSLTDAHVNVNPSEALTLSIVALMGTFLITLLISTALYLFTDSFPVLFLVLGLIGSLFVFYYAYSMPQRLALAWRLRASSQMVPAILYVVVYMKHTSNLERAIEFASEHLEGPLALDFKKIFYDVETSKYSSIKQSLDNYLESWKDYSPEFVESFHLIESSLYESSEQKRVQTLEKSLQVILDGVYEKMLKYSREIRSPLTNIYMLGIILPTLGLALLPLASTLLGGMIQWYHVFVIFNFIIPFFVWYLASEALMKRPGGYGESSILELNPQYSEFKSQAPWISGLAFLIPLLIIGFLPFLFQIDAFTSLLGLQSDYTLKELGLPFFEDQKLFDFKEAGGHTIGPFSPFGVLLSLFIPLSLALYFSSVYRKKTKNLIASRNDTKMLEEEFTNSLFQLGNRLGDGIPAEIAFGKVAESTKGQKTQNFFALVNQNIQQLGMPVERAIFDKKRGALTYYPSSLIATSMKILIESSKKGLQVAARSLMSISEYVKNIEKINQRLRDLLAEIVSDMKSNMTFLAPLLAGIVVGLSSMITVILNKIQAVQDLQKGAEATTSLGTFSSITSIFNLKEMIPPTFIQITIGIYLIEVIFILTAALVTVDAGKDTLKEKNELSSYLKTGIFLYTITALLSIIALAALAIITLGNLG